MLFSVKDPIQRWVFFCLSIIIVILLCYFHGVLERTRTVRCIHQMISNGNLIGKFWRVIDSRNDQLTITKYEYTLTLTASSLSKVRTGDRISFIAKSLDKNSSKKKHWYTTKARVHGSSSLKFIFSFVSVGIVFAMTIRHFRFDAKTVSLTLKRGKG